MQGKKLTAVYSGKLGVDTGKEIERCQRQKSGESVNQRQKKARKNPPLPAPQLLQIFQHRFPLALFHPITLPSSPMGQGMSMVLVMFIRMTQGISNIPCRRMSAKSTAIQ